MKITREDRSKTKPDFVLMRCPSCGRTVYYHRGAKSSCCEYHKAKKLIPEKL